MIIFKKHNIQNEIIRWERDVYERFIECSCSIPDWTNLFLFFSVKYWTSKSWKNSLYKQLEQTEWLTFEVEIFTRVRSVRGRAPAHAIFQKNRTSHVRTRAIFSYDQNSKSHAKSQFSHKITRFFSYSSKFGPVLENIIIKSIQMNFRFDQKTDFHLIRHTNW